MGKKGSWVSAVKKVLSPDPKEKKDKKLDKAKKKWFGKHERRDLDTSSPKKALAAPSRDGDEVKLVEIENGTSENAYNSNAARYFGKSKLEVAAIKIQAAFRGYLARRALSALRGLVRLKLMTQGQSVKRQATITLRCMQTLARLQSQICKRRIRMTEENQALQRQLQHTRDKELDKLRATMGDEWDDSMQSKEKIEANLQSKLEAAVRRERAMAYAYSQQLQMMKNSSSPTFMDPNNPHWGWSWLERWMAARPWENRTIVDNELNNDHASIRTTTSRRAISVGEINISHSRRDFTNFDNTKKSKTRNAKRSGGYGGDEDLRSMQSAWSERHRRRRHSIVGSSSSIRDDESFASSPGSSPRYMALTESAKARCRVPSPLGLEKTGTPEKVLLGGSAKKRLSYSASPIGLSRRHSGTLKDKGGK